jgi:hypothetical protein
MTVLLDHYVTINIKEYIKIIMSRNLLYLLVALSFTSVLVFFLYSYSQKNTEPITSYTPAPPEEQPAKNSEFEGTLMLGSSIETKSYCSEGIYIVAKDEEYFRNDSKMLLLKTPAGEQNALYSDTTYLDQSVKVTGVYPAQEMFCQALMCDCEDYILVTDVVSKTGN